MQSCCFFSPDLFMKISNFSKTVQTIFTKFCTVILHPKGPLRVQKASKLYGWDVRNIAKISPKMAKKQSFSIFFSIFSKTVHTIRTKFSTVIFYTIVWSYVCNFNKFVWFWDWSESEGKRPKPTPLPHMRLWFLFQWKFETFVYENSVSFHVKFLFDPTYQSIYSKQSIHPRLKAASLYFVMERNFSLE